MGYLGTGGWTDPGDITDLSGATKVDHAEMDARLETMISNMVDNREVLKLIGDLGEKTFGADGDDVPSAGVWATAWSLGSVAFDRLVMVTFVAPVLVTAAESDHFAIGAVKGSGNKSYAGLAAQAGNALFLSATDTGFHMVSGCAVFTVDALATADIFFGMVLDYSGLPTTEAELEGAAKARAIALPLIG